MGDRYRDDYGGGRGNGPVEGKIYVGGLPSDAQASELEDAFGRYGRLRKVWVARRPSGFAFVEFEDGRDAEDAARALDGTRLCGVRAKVEVSHGKRRGGQSRSMGGGGGGGGGGRDSRRSPGGYRGRSRSPPARRGRSPPPRSPPPRRSRSRSPYRRRSYSGSPAGRGGGGGGRQNGGGGDRSRSRS